MSLMAAKLIREGRMPAPGVLSEALSGGRSVGKVKRKLSRSSTNPGYHKVFVSSSTREGSTPAHARAGLLSPEFHNLVTLTHSLPGIHAADSGMGFWSDGAEESRIVDTDPHRVPWLAARLGKAMGQKAAIGFSSGPGEDIAHVLRVPMSDPERIANVLQKNGIEFKTIVPDRADQRRSVVHILDSGGESTPKIERAARELGAHHERHAGTVHFIPAEQYDDILNGQSHHGV